MKKTMGFRGLALMVFAGLVSGMSVFAAESAKKRACECVQDGPDVIPFCVKSDGGAYPNLLSCMQGCPHECRTSALKAGGKVRPPVAK